MYVLAQPVLSLSLSLSLRIYYCLIQALPYLLNEQAIVRKIIYN